MADRTGIARGTLRPCIYFVRRTDMTAILAPAEVGSGLELARMVYERRYKHDWMWCEATTLQEIDALQKRLANQELHEAQKKIQVNSLVRDRVFQQTGDALRQQMCSASTTQWEKDWIREYFKLRDAKRDRYRDSLLHHNYYIWARENYDSAKVDDSIPLLPGQFERGTDGRTPTEVLKQVDEHNAGVQRMGL
jgi:hypothetical protein